jgi:hypothetical protein
MQSHDRHHVGEGAADMVRKSTVGGRGGRQPNCHHTAVNNAPAQEHSSLDCPSTALEETMSELSKPDVTAVWMLTVPQHVQMLEHMNSLASAWMKRRQEALTSGLQACQQMAACQDPATAAKVCADWMGGSLHRIMADISDTRDHADKMAELSRSAMQAMSGQAAATMAAASEQVRAVAAAPAEASLRQAA